MPRSSTTRPPGDALRLLHVGAADLHATLEACLAAAVPPVRVSHARALPTDLDDVDVLLLDEPLADGLGSGALARLPVVLVRPDPPTRADMVQAVEGGAEDLICLAADESVEVVGRITAAAARHRARAELQARLANAEDGEDRFQRMIQANADGVMIVDQEGIIRFVNEAAQKLFARGADRLVGESFGSPLVSGTTTELDVVLPGGTTTVVELRVVEIPWEGDSAHLVSLRDITDRRAAEERSVELAREQEARKAAEAAGAEARLLADVGDVLDTSLDLAETLQELARSLVPRLADWCTVDLLEGEEAPRRFAAAAGADEAVLTELAERYPLRVHSRQPAAQALRQESPFHLRSVSDAWLAEVIEEEDHRALLAQLGVRSLIAVVLPTREGVTGVLTLVRSGEERYGEAEVRLAEEVARRAGHTVERVRLFQEAQAGNRAKADFLAVMSHELRTPLNSIIGYTDLLQAGIAGDMGEEQSAKLKRIKLSARHLLQLIEEILSFARMEAGRERVRPERTAAAEVLEEVAALTEPLARERGLDFVVEGTNGKTLVTDVPKVRQILLNLLTNAVKFTDEGQVAVAFEEGPGNDRVRFVVRDTGPGIEPDHLRRIFEPFWQVERPQTRRAGGTGLGLSVARRLARLMGGDLTVDSTPGQGSTFVLELPRHVEPTEGRQDPFEDDGPHRADKPAEAGSSQGA